MSPREVTRNETGNGQGPFGPFQVMGAAPIMDMWSLTAETFGAWNTASLRTWQACGKEWYTFLGTRLAEDAALPKRLGACGTPQELWSTYASFWQKAVEDYQREFSRLAELSRAGFAAAQNSGEAVRGGRPDRPPVLSPD